LTAPILSIIIPAYNEEQRLPAALDQIHSFLFQQSYTAEVLVVENGSTDRTLQLAQAAAARMPEVRVLHSDLKGKGAAVKMGMLAAQGEYRFICDVDLSMPIAEVNRFFPPALPQMDVAIASREAPGSLRIDEPWRRHWTGRSFNALVRWTLLPGLHDTQCGFKCFRAQVAEECFSRQTISGWSFDVEVLYLARQRGYHIVEVPITWYFNPESKVNVLRDLKQVVHDLWTIWRNARRGLYH
jgi:dolichyl-phosphate beta-glucosyltransferase